MATIIDCGNGRYIAGDPDTTIHVGNHWCEFCHGDGLDYDLEGELTTCGMCCGVGQVECDRPDCAEHRTAS